MRTRHVQRVRRAPLSGAPPDRGRWLGATSARVGRRVARAWRAGGQKAPRRLALCTPSPTRTQRIAPKLASATHAHAHQQRQRKYTAKPPRPTCALAPSSSLPGRILQVCWPLARPVQLAILPQSGRSHSLAARWRASTTPKPLERLLQFSLPSSLKPQIKINTARSSARPHLYQQVSSLPAPH